jgi:hypothetical protein
MVKFYYGQILPPGGLARRFAAILGVSGLDPAFPDTHRAGFPHADAAL